MSNVSNCLLSFSVLEHELHRVFEVNSYFSEGFGFVSVKDPKLPYGWYGGTKILETTLYLAALNHLNEPDFLKHLATDVAWQKPEYVQFIVKRQESELFQIIHLPGIKIPDRNFESE